MKDIFKGYYRLNRDDFETLWNNAVFIFDTNVLLNFYRYQSSTRDTLIQVMEKMLDRIWIPYHVGLEYQRNRLTVIAEQQKKFSEVKSIVQNSISDMRKKFDPLKLKKRHSHINPDQLLEKFEEINKGFVEELNKLEEKSISVNSTDKIRDRIDVLFHGRIGSGPQNQDEIDSLVKEGDLRYRDSIPPGFRDSSKDDSSPDEFSYAGITYKRKYGDLIIWKQIIKFATDTNLKDIIFITDDAKADWWWKIDSNGKKTIGVRPELTDEIHRESKVERFHVYNTEGFLNYANEKLNAQVAEEAIQEVREVSDQRRDRLRRFKKLHDLARSAEKAVFDWLLNSIHSLKPNGHGYPDFIGYQDKKKFGFEVKLIRDHRIVLHRFKDEIYRAYFGLKEEGFYEITIILVVLDEHSISKVVDRVKQRLPELEGNLRIIIGLAEFDEDSGSVFEFLPHEEVYISH